MNKEELFEREPEELSLFHGTDQESAKSILESGFRPRDGDDTIWLTTSFENAALFAKQTWHPAVVNITTNSDLLKECECKIPDKNQLLKEMVKAGRWIDFGGVWISCSKEIKKSNYKNMEIWEKTYPEETE